MMAETLISILIQYFYKKLHKEKQCNLTCSELLVFFVTKN